MEDGQCVLERRDTRVTLFCMFGLSHRRLSWHSQVREGFPYVDIVALC